MSGKERAQLGADHFETLDFFREMDRQHGQQQGLMAGIQGDTVPPPKVDTGWTNPGMWDSIYSGLGIPSRGEQPLADYSSLKPSSTPQAVREKALDLHLSPVELASGGSFFDHSWEWAKHAGVSLLESFNPLEAGITPRERAFRAANDATLFMPVGWMAQMGKAGMMFPALRAAAMTASGRVALHALEGSVVSAGLEMIRDPKERGEHGIALAAAGGLVFGAAAGKLTDALLSRANRAATGKIIDRLTDETKLAGSLLRDDWAILPHDRLDTPFPKGLAERQYGRLMKHLEETGYSSVEVKLSDGRTGQLIGGLDEFQAASLGRELGLDHAWTKAGRVDVDRGFIHPLDAGGMRLGMGLDDLSSWVAIPQRAEGSQPVHLGLAHQELPTRLGASFNPADRDAWGVVADHVDYQGSGVAGSLWQRYRGLDTRTLTGRLYSQVVNRLYGAGLVDLAATGQPGWKLKVAESLQKTLQVERTRWSSLAQTAILHQVVDPEDITQVVGKSLKEVWSPLKPSEMPMLEMYGFARHWAHLHDAGEVVPEGVAKALKNGVLREALANTPDHVKSVFQETVAWRNNLAYQWLVKSKVISESKWRQFVDRQPFGIPLTLAENKARDLDGEAARVVAQFDPVRRISPELDPKSKWVPWTEEIIRETAMRARASSNQRAVNMLADRLDLSPAFMEKFAKRVTDPNLPEELKVVKGSGVNEVGAAELHAGRERGLAPQQEMDLPKGEPRPGPGEAKEDFPKPPLRRTVPGAGQIGEAARASAEKAASPQAELGLGLATPETPYLGQGLDEKPWSIGKEPEPVHPPVPGMDPNLLREAPEAGIPLPSAVFTTRGGQYIRATRVTPSETLPLFEGQGGLGDKFETVWYQLNTDSKKGTAEARNLWDSISSLQPTQLDAVTKIGGLAGSMLRAGVTGGPEFLGKNPVRDLLFGLVKGGTNAVNPFFFHTFTSGIASLVKQDEHYVNWLASGGARSALSSMDRTYLRDLVRDMSLTAGQGGPQARALRLANVLKHPLQTMIALSEAVENGTRIGVFKRSLSKLGGGAEAFEKAEWTGAQLMEAGLASREASVDFSVAGANMMMQKLRVMTAFFGASFASADSLGRAFAQDPVGVGTRAALAITLPSLALYAINRQDPDYMDGIPTWEKNLFWHVKRNDLGPLATALGDDPTTTEDDLWLRIPKPFEPGMLAGSMVERFLESVDEEQPGALDEHMAEILGEITSGMSPVPTAIGPLLDIMRNKSGFTGDPIVPLSQVGKVDPDYQSGPGTSDFAKGFAHWVNHGVEDAGQKISPYVVDYATRGWTGGLGRVFIGDLGDQVAAAWRAKVGEDHDRLGMPYASAPAQEELEKLPLVRGFVSRFPYANQSTDDFFRVADRVANTQGTLDYLKQSLQVEDQVDWTLGHAQTLGLAGLVTQTQTQLQAIRKSKAQVLSAPLMKPEEKRAAIRELDQASFLLARTVMHTLRGLDQGEAQPVQPLSAPVRGLLNP